METKNADLYLVINKLKEIFLNEDKLEAEVYNLEKCLQQKKQELSVLRNQNMLPYKQLVQKEILSVGPFIEVAGIHLLLKKSIDDCLVFSYVSQPSNYGTLFIEIRMPGRLQDFYVSFRHKINTERGAEEISMTGHDSTLEEAVSRLEKFCLSSVRFLEHHPQQGSDIPENG